MPKRVRDTAGQGAPLGVDPRLAALEAELEERQRREAEAAEPAPEPEPGDRTFPAGGSSVGEKHLSVGQSGHSAIVDEWAEAEALAAELAAGEPEPEPEDERHGEEAIEDESETPPEPRLPGVSAQEAADAMRRLADASLMPASAPKLPKFRATLLRLGERREANARVLAETEAALWQAIREANAAGVPKLTISKDAGVSRQTVYNILGKEAE